MNKLTQERVTNAELGIENTQLKGYIKGTEDHPYNIINKTRGKKFDSEMQASAPNTKNMMIHSVAEILKEK